MKLSFLQIKNMVKCWYLWFNIAVGMCACMRAQAFQSCLTLCDSMDGSLPGSSVHGNSPGKNTGVGCRALLQEHLVYTLGNAILRVKM